MVRHALFKALLFLSCGFIIIIIFGSQDLRFLGEEAASRKRIYFMPFLSNLSLCGFPFLSGFFSKDLIIEFSFLTGLNLFSFCLFIFSCFFSLIYRLKIVVIGLSNIKIQFVGSKRVFSFYKAFIIYLLFFWAICLGKIVGYLLIDGEGFHPFLFERVLGFSLFLLGMGFIFLVGFGVFLKVFRGVLEIVNLN